MNSEAKIAAPSEQVQELERFIKILLSALIESARETALATSLDDVNIAAGGLLQTLLS